jgi:hypothetical protein
MHHAIEGENIRLLGKHKHVECQSCEAVLALIGKEGLLIKSFISYINLENNQITVRCGKCKKYGTFSLDGFKNPKCLLTV